MNLHRCLRIAACCAAWVGLAPLAARANDDAPPATPARAAAEPLAEVRQFMADYGRALRTHDREAIVSLYHSKGALIVVDGLNEALPPEAIGGFYRTQWEGPKHFEWAGLNYHVLSPENVVVTGAFLWQTPQEPKPHKVNFSALLVREEGGWRIRAEMEFKSRGE